MSFHYLSDVIASDGLCPECQSALVVRFSYHLSGFSQRQTVFYQMVDVMTDIEFHPVADLFPLMQGGEFDELVADIREHGLLEPIWLYEGRILDGRNRFRACQFVGFQPETRCYEGDDPVGFVVSLNLTRRHLSESQRAMAGANIANIRRGNVGKNHEKSDRQICLSEAADKMNVSERSIKTAKQVYSKGIPRLADKVESGAVKVSVAADVATLPDNQQEVIVNLGEKAILQAAKEIRSKKAKARQEENERLRQKALSVPPPEGQYRCIVMDPPWPMQKIDRDVRPQQSAELDYPVMTLGQIMDIKVPSADLCHLYLWTTQRFIWDCRSLLDNWGFQRIALMVWHKPGGFQPTGLPQYNCEFVLIARKGGLTFDSTKDFPLCFQAPRREHSRKPDEFYDLVRRVSPGPRLDMFSREAREGFEQFGNQTNAFL